MDISFFTTIFKYTCIHVYITFDFLTEDIGRRPGFDIDQTRQGPACVHWSAPAGNRRTKSETSNAAINSVLKITKLSLDLGNDLLFEV